MLRSWVKNWSAELPKVWSIMADHAFKYGTGEGPANTQSVQISVDIEELYRCCGVVHVNMAVLEGTDLRHKDRLESTSGSSMKVIETPYFELKHHKYQSWNCSDNSGNINCLCPLRLFLVGI